MAPEPKTKEIEEQRYLLDPEYGAINIKNFISRIRDGYYCLDNTSDYTIGVVSVAVLAGDMPSWAAQCLQRPFVLGQHLRYSMHHFGRPFLDHDGCIMRFKGRLLQGNIRENGSKNVAESKVTIEEFMSDDRFAAWRKKHLLRAEPVYNSIHASNNSKKTVDEMVNAARKAGTFIQGPLSSPPPGDSYTFRTDETSDSTNFRREDRKSNRKAPAATKSKKRKPQSDDEADIPAAESSKDAARRGTRSAKISRTSIMQKVNDSDSGDQYPEMDVDEGSPDGTRTVQERAVSKPNWPWPAVFDWMIQKEGGAR